MGKSGYAALVLLAAAGFVFWWARRQDGRQFINLDVLTGGAQSLGPVSTNPARGW